MAVLFLGLWLIDHPQWIKHLQAFGDSKHIVDLQILVDIKLRASDVSLKRAKTCPKSQDVSDSSLHLSSIPSPSTEGKHSLQNLVTHTHFVHITYMQYTLHKKPGVSRMTKCYDVRCLRPFVQVVIFWEDTWHPRVDLSSKIVPKTTNQSYSRDLNHLITLIDDDQDTDSP